MLCINGVHPHRSGSIIEAFTTFCSNSQVRAYYSASWRRDEAAGAIRGAAIPHLTTLKNTSTKTIFSILSDTCQHLAGFHRIGETRADKGRNVSISERLKLPVCGMGSTERWQTIHQIPHPTPTVGPCVATPSCLSLHRLSGAFTDSRQLFTTHDVLLAVQGVKRCSGRRSPSYRRDASLRSISRLLWSCDVAEVSRSAPNYDIKKFCWRSGVNDSGVDAVYGPSTQRTRISKM